MTLTEAAAAGDLPLVLARIDEGAAVDDRDGERQTALHRAAAAGHLDIARALLDAGADPNAPARVRRHHITPLGIALEGCHREVAAALIAAGARPDAIPSIVRTALRRAIHENDRETVRLLHSAGVDLIPQGDGKDLLGRAAYLGHAAMIRVLIEAGVPPDSPGLFGETALVDAVTAGQAGAVAALLEAGASVHPPGGRPLLVAAASSGQAEVVRLLLDAGIDPATANSSGLTPAEIAALGGYDDVLAALGPAAAETARLRDARLVAAAFRGDADEVARLIRGGADPNARAHVRGDHWDRPALVLAVIGGHLAAVDARREAGADPAASSGSGGTIAGRSGPAEDDPFLAPFWSRRDESRDPPWGTGTGAGHAAVVRALLGAGADPNARSNPYRIRDGNGNVLMLASRFGLAGIVRDLLRAGASVHAKDTPADQGYTDTPGGRTALAYAAENDHAGVVDVLLEAGAYVDARDRVGRTPLMAAASRGRLAMVERLLDAGANADAVDRFGGTALADGLLQGDPALTRRLADAFRRAPPPRAVARALNVAISRGEAELVEDLLTWTADVNARDPGGSTPLFVAAVLGREALVVRLLGLGADPNVGNEGGDGPLARAATAGHAAIVRLLLDAGADPNAPGESGRPPVLASVHESGRIPLPRAGDPGASLAMLIAAGADLEARDEQGRTALQVAAEVGDDELAAILRAAGAPTAGVAEAELRRAATGGDPARIRALAAAVADVDEPGPRGHTALMLAAGRGDPESVRALLDLGADPNLATEAGSPLSLAAWWEDAESVRLLIEAGADVNASPGNPPRTALGNAIAKESREIFGVLLAAGARPYLPLDPGEMPALCWAVRDAGMARMLLDAGADPCEPDPRDLRTPLHFAADRGPVASIRLLLDAGADPRARDDDGRTPGDVAEARSRRDAAAILRAAEASRAP